MADQRGIEQAVGLESTDLEADLDAGDQEANIDQDQDRDQGAGSEDRGQDRT